MSEPLREMVSAVVDDEASEFENRRVLDNLKDTELRHLIGRHYALRSVLRGEVDRFCPGALTDRILLAVEAEQPAVRHVGRWRAPLRGFAVAASVCLVAVLAAEMLIDRDRGATPVPAQAAMRGGASLGELGRSAQPALGDTAMASKLGFGSAVPVVAGASSGGDLGEEANRIAQQRLRRYLLEHAQNAELNGNQGMLPYARVVNYDEQ